VSVASHPEFPELLCLMGAIVKENFTICWEGDLFRAVSSKYAGSQDLISGDGSKMYGGRWNAPGSFRTVYGSSCALLATREALAHYRQFNIPEKHAMPLTIKAISVKLSSVVNLTDAIVHQRLGVSLDRLMKDDWRNEKWAHKESLTQAVGHAAKECGVEAIMAPSARSEERQDVNVAIFPDNLRPESKMSVL